MFKSILGTVVGTFFILSSFAQHKVSHEQWTDLLQKHVDPYGKVDYKGFKADEALLDKYLDKLRSKPPEQYWKVQEQKTYWINAYNAFTIKLILMNYPLKSIMEIKVDGKNAWNIPFIELGGKKYTLDYIEKTLLLGQFNDPRIHFAVNCSAKSCPILRNKAYSSDNLDIELRLATRRFINDDRFNILSENHVQVSQIFNWYKDDFVNEEGSVQEYLNAYTMHMEISKNASLNFLNYNWDLNEK